MEAEVERGYEGDVAKDEASAYQGGPTRRWLKVKQDGRGDPLATADEHGAAGSVDRRSRKRMACGTLPAGSLLTELDAFYTEHQL